MPRRRFNANQNPQEWRAFHLGDHKNSFHDDLHESLVEATKGLRRHRLESVSLRDFHARLFAGKVDPFPDGQREIVCNFKWMKTLVSSLVDTAAPLDAILVNDVEDVWFVNKGKQRTSTLFAFFIGLIPAEIDGTLYFWTKNDECPHGWSYLFCGKNANGKRVCPEEDDGASFRLKKWFDDLNCVIGEEVEDASKCEYFTDEMKQKFLDITLDFQILPNWPQKAAALYTVWTEMKCFKQTATECVYGTPGLREFKIFEPTIQAFAKSFEIQNDKKQAFCDMIRAYMFLVGCEFIPFAKDTQSYDVIIGELTNDFLIKTPEDGADSKKALGLIKTANHRLSDIRSRIKGRNANRAVKSISSDLFVCFIVMAAKKKDVADFDRAVVAFRATNKARKDVLGNDYKLWEKGEEDGNFFYIIKAFI